MVKSGKICLFLHLIEAMAGLVGEYEVKLDAKGRFLFPAALRKQLPSAADRDFMLNKGFEDELILTPAAFCERCLQ